MFHKFTQTVTIAAMLFPDFNTDHIYKTVS